MKLLRKREFRETLQTKITDETLQTNVCAVEEFEYTSVQKFVAQFMSPKTPYNGMLLYHGVGVGKTCTAILAAEAFLELSPKNKVFIIAPPAIQPGFYRTIFDSSRIKFGSESDVPNEHEGCTGNRYLYLTQTQYEREKKDIELRVNKLINKRYSIMGYVAFRNMVKEIIGQIPVTLNPEKKAQQETRLLQNALSGSLIIVDEAHNMRDVSDDADDADDLTSGAPDERSDSSGGKKLAPYLRKVLETCEGNKLLLMSATPMYNTYSEIVSLLNYLLYADHVDKSQLLRESDIKFQMNESGEQLTPESEARIIKVANGRVSFMRGENPKAFPARLDPADSLRLKEWPDRQPNGKEQIPVEQRTDVLRLPLVKCELSGDSLAVMRYMTEKLVSAKGVGIRTIDTLLQAGNCIFPGEGLDGRIGNEGFQNLFTSKAVAATFDSTRISFLPQYVPADSDPNTYSWMTTGRNSLGKYSPKFNQILQSIRSGTGISFVYSRFVENGAVIFCLLLEANGYTAWGRSAPLFKANKPADGGRQCAKCEKKEKHHPAFIKEQPESRENHIFSPAYYALLTASSVDTVEKQSLPLSPNNPRVVSVARDFNNSDGSKIKVIVGSQVAGEGLDLRAIREIHILEGWFHLSKQEQIIGRGIRYCSHQGLPYQERNCIINLYVNVFPPDINKETIDLYTYRNAMNKAVRVGNVSRALKQGATDCNVNREAILVSGLKNVRMVDNQRVERDQDLNDKDYTSICDWIRCAYTCKPSIDIKRLPEDNQTYDIFSARFAEQSMISRLKKLIKEQTWFRWEDIQEIFKDIPKATLTALLLRTVNNPSVTFENGHVQGHLIYRNNLFLFQPSTIQDHGIPLSLRYGRYPIKRDYYEPEKVTSAKPAIVTKARAFKVKATVLPIVENENSDKDDDSVEQGQEAALPVAPVAPVASEINMDATRAFWSDINSWIDTWAKDGTQKANILENIPDTLSESLLRYTENDSEKKDNYISRLKKLQWWGQSIANVPDGLSDLRKAARQFAWDSILKGPEQIALLEEGVAYAEEAGNEQLVNSGSIKGFRYLDMITRQPIYKCSGMSDVAGSTTCPPSVLQLFITSKTDPVINAKATPTTASEIYGFMVPWENLMMFKTNSPKPGNKDPGQGAACAIVSTVSAHRKKLVELGIILARYDAEKKTYDLTDQMLSKGGRALTGAANFCALMEIVMRWMDIRRERYGGLKFFYRPLSAFYSKHKSKK